MTLNIAFDDQAIVLRVGNVTLHYYLNDADGRESSHPKAVHPSNYCSVTTHSHALAWSFKAQGPLRGDFSISLPETCGRFNIPPYYFNFYLTHP